MAKLIMWECLLDSRIWYWCYLTQEVEQWKICTLSHVLPIIFLHCAITWTLNGVVLCYSFLPWRYWSKAKLLFSVFVAKTFCWSAHRCHLKISGNVLIVIGSRNTLPFIFALKIRTTLIRIYGKCKTRVNITQEILLILWFWIGSI